MAVAAVTVVVSSKMLLILLLKRAKELLFIFIKKAGGLDWEINLELMNFKIKDYDSGFVAVKREVLDNVKFNPEGHGEYCIEFLYKCTRKDYKVKEIGYVFTERKLGESKTSQYVYSVFVYGAHYIRRILKVRFKD